MYPCSIELNIILVNCNEYSQMTQTQPFTIKTHIYINTQPLLWRLFLKQINTHWVKLILTSCENVVCQWSWKIIQCYVFLNNLFLLNVWSLEDAPKKSIWYKNAYLYGTLCPSLVFNPIPIRLKSIEFLTKCEAWKLECFTM